ncbi:MAG: hypothetical protein ABF242_08710 [Flavobacteriales bacterium]
MKNLNMESRLLYKTTKLKESSIKWEIINGSEWISYFQNKKSNFNLIHNIIEKHLITNEIYLVWERNNSGLIKYKHDKMLRCFLTVKNNFSLWNLDLTKTIEFNEIGIFKYGSIE